MPSEQERAEVRVIAQASAKPGKADALRAALLGMLAPSRAEPGCLLYELHEDRDTPGRFTFIERWADDAALDRHNQTPHLKALGPKIADLVAGPPVLHHLTVIG